MTTHAVNVETQTGHRVRVHVRNVAELEDALHAHGERFTPDAVLTRALTRPGAVVCFGALKLRREA